MKIRKWCQAPKSARRSTNTKKEPSSTKKGPGRFPVKGEVTQSRRSPNIHRL
jgi:hypothetical protein